MVVGRHWDKGISILMILVSSFFFTVSVGQKNWSCVLFLTILLGMLHYPVYHCMCDQVEDLATVSLSKFTHSY